LAARPDTIWPGRRNSWRATDGRSPPPRLWQSHWFPWGLPTGSTA
jgi:hypothetical protein